MGEKGRRAVRYIAAALFAIMAIWELYDYVHYYAVEDRFWRIDFIGYFLPPFELKVFLVASSIFLAVSLFLDKRVGALIGALLKVINAVVWLGYVLYWENEFGNIGITPPSNYADLIAQVVAQVVMCVLLLLSIYYNGGKKKTRIPIITGLSAAGLCTILNVVYVGLPTESAVVWMLLKVSAYVMLGFAKFSPTANKQQGISKRISENNSVSTIERLTKLKELLDMGAITQQEFDTKKAEILKE